jgi:parallel beta-helix repeat protein
VHGYDAGVFVSGDNNRVTNITASANRIGILVNCWSWAGRISPSIRNRVTDNTASANDIGIYLGCHLSNVFTESNRVTSNTTNENTDTGIADGPGSGDNVIQGNTANGNVVAGVVLHDAPGSPMPKATRVVGNTTNDNGDSGIIDWLGSRDNVIKGNTANSNHNSGIVLHDAPGSPIPKATRVVGNTTNENGASGILDYLYSRENVIVNNTANGNRIAGIALEDSADNVLPKATRVVGNTTNENRYGIVDVWGSRENVIVGNDADSNGICGIILEDWLGFPAPKATQVRGNSASYNGMGGIWLLRNADGNVIRGNEALENAMWGIRSSSTTVSFPDDNLIQGNTSLDNSFDLIEENPVCANTWKSNTFVSEVGHVDCTD